MKVVAFLQNMWVKDPASAQRSIDRDTTGKLRARLIKYALFAGCLTGRRLRAALGEDLCDQIVWEEANPVIADNPKTYYPPCESHIVQVLAKHGPDVVICFSRPAEPMIRSLFTGPVISACHPAARGADTIRQLEAVKSKLARLAASVPSVPSGSPSLQGGQP